MHMAVKPIQEILKVNAIMYGYTFEGIDEPLARKQLQPNANSLTWLLGHVASTKFYMGGLIGIDEKCPWGEIFDGSITKADQSKYPPLPEIWQSWDEITSKVLDRLPQLSESKLGEPLPFKFPTQEQTILAGLSFLAMHEAYHVGQISTQRRLLGVDSLFDIAVREMRKQ